MRGRVRTGAHQHGKGLDHRKDHGRDDLNGEPVIGVLFADVNGGLRQHDGDLAGLPLNGFPSGDQKATLPSRGSAAGRKIAAQEAARSWASDG